MSDRKPQSAPAVPLAETHRSAIALHRRGELDEAAKLYRSILRRDPAHFDALNNLGTIRAQRGFPVEAEKLFRRALRTRPDSGEAHYNLALALGALNRSAESAEHMARAVALAFPRALAAAGQVAAPRGTLADDFNAALVAQHQGDLPTAERLYRAVLQRDPWHFEASNNLGVLYVRLERHTEAAALLTRAIERRPDSADARHSLAMALRMLDRHTEALAHAQRAVAIRPNYAEALTNLGSIELGLKHYEVALVNIERAVALKPDFAPAHADLGQALQALGRLDDARVAFERAVARDPHQPAFYKALGQLKRYAADDPQLAAMEALARDLDALLPQQRPQLHFALGKAYENLGRHEESFDHYLEGNRLMRQRMAYDEPFNLRWLERVRTVFSAELLRSRAGRGHPSAAPVFIVGMPRSGSTLIEQILASHPMVSARGELEDLKRLVDGLETPAGATSGFPELISVLSDERLRQIGRDYCAAAGASDSGMPRVVDKMPGNFVFAGLISLALPNARVIHTRRDPIDTCLSCFALLFTGDHQPHTYDLGELGRYYRAYAALMEHWRTVLPPETFLEVSYEDVVEDLEREARRLIAHCGLPWDPACLDFHRTKRGVLTASFAQVRQPLYRSSLGRSQRYLHRLGPLIEALGGAS